MLISQTQGFGKNTGSFGATGLAIAQLQAGLAPRFDDGVGTNIRFGQRGLGPEPTCHTASSILKMTRRSLSRTSREAIHRMILHT
jgi:hypothetical protein